MTALSARCSISRYYPSTAVAPIARPGYSVSNSAVHTSRAVNHRSLNATPTNSCAAHVALAPPTPGSRRGAASPGATHTCEWLCHPPHVGSAGLAARDPQSRRCARVAQVRHYQADPFSGVLVLHDLGIYDWYVDCDSCSAAPASDILPEAVISVVKQWIVGDETLLTHMLCIVGLCDSP